MATKEASTESRYARREQQPTKHRLCFPSITNVHWLHRACFFFFFFLFLELAGLHLISKAQRGQGTRHKCCVHARSTLWEHQRVASLAQARVERESVCMTGMHQYVACSYKYRYGSKYTTLWTCPEGTVSAAVFLS